MSLIPKVCICVPVCNSAGTITDTLNSLLSQTYKNVDIFVVDNHSTDNTLDIVHDFCVNHPHIQFFSFDEQLTGEGNFTRCLQLTTGDYTGIFHSDDVYSNEMIAKQVDFLEKHPQAAVVFTAGREINEMGQTIGERRLPKALFKRSGTGVYDFITIFKLILKYGNFFICPSALARTKVYKELGVWGDEKRFFGSSDLGVWLQILEQHPVGLINEPLINYRISSSSASFRLLKTRTERHLKLLLLDDYMKKIPHDQLTQDDRLNYVFLQLKDNVSRAIVFLLQKKRKEALELVKPFFLSANIHAALTSFHRAKIFLMGMAVYVFCHMPLSVGERKMIEFLRYGRDKSK